MELGEASRVQETFIHSKVRESFQAGLYEDVIASVPSLQRVPECISLIPLVLRAAMRINSTHALEVAVDLAIQAESSPEERATHALLLARGSFMTEAFIVMMADPNIRWIPDYVSLIVPVLSMLKRSMNKSLPAARAAIKFGSSLKKSNMLSPSPDQSIKMALTKSKLGFPAKIRELRPEFYGPPTISVISDASLKARQEAFARGLEQAEDQILRHRVPDVVEIENVFLNRFGDIWKEDGTIVKAVSNRLKPDKFKVASVLQQDNLIAACAVESSKNPYLWCTRILPSLAWRWDLRGLDLPIGVSDTARPWVAESIRLASAETPTIFEVGDAVFVKRLILPNWNMHFLTRHAAYAECFSRIFERVNASGIPLNSSPIYISRRDSGRRSMRNEVELEGALSKRGILPIVLTGLSLSEKINLFRKAPLIVGAHGAGFGNLVFAERGREVVEVLPVHTPLTHHRVNIPNLSRIMGHKHHHYLALPLKAYDDDSWELNIDEFLTFFDNYFG